MDAFGEQLTCRSGTKNSGLAGLASSSKTPYYYNESLK
jgi:hypothetical protein